MGRVLHVEQAEKEQDKKEEEKGSDGPAGRNTEKHDDQGCAVRHFGCFLLLKRAVEERSRGKK